MITTKALTWACGLLLAALVALGLAYWLQSIALRSCRVEVDRQKVDVDRLEAEKVRLLGTIKDQNEAVGRLKVAADEKAAQAAQALASARESAGKYEASRKRLAALLGAPTPPGAGCKQAADLVRAELRK